ncbi:MAG: hypothetical protein WBP85_01230, partial [Terracidiphilus sp.]
TEPVTLEMPKSACLLLFEMLTTAYELWRKANPDDASANPMVIAAQTHAERVALWKLEGVLERTLPELFSSNYEALLEESRQQLAGLV